MNVDHVGNHRPKVTMNVRMVGIVGTVIVFSQYTMNSGLPTIHIIMIP